ncbi:MAG: 16S rRNA (cytidine(1402)-2'-O)-methyltransferase [candidate division KSB1 bacterium]|nr:16S rRNA (cytidine(1402)-2'-O)-methyltransferase [candidate division KSB1 bacterium]MDZ7368816.1 16S rRNA (cytidine(1402)-2'-O)-methyltransferase [candidate division KSB1 bacterium]MDZ7406660.1 16S rRNA (cytidine(1402)-2'-O)-methyltransferase [candidate division KSB1 bacterium]
MAGKLYLVATPIGNLQDITFRAVETLRQVDLIAAEDTRHAAILLRHYDIHKPTVSYHDFNERKAAPQLVAQLQEGKSIALITDAGSPGISDPGFYLVRAALAENIIVEAIPGPSACVAAVTISGLPCDRFVFEGFPPAKKGRQTFFQNLANEPRTIVLYEAPQRVARTLQEILAHWGDRRAALARELTKIHQEVRRGKVSEILAGLQEQNLRGECVLVVEGRPKTKADSASRRGE